MDVKNIRIENIEPANEAFANKAIGIATMPSGLKLEVRTFNFMNGYPDEPIHKVPCRYLRELSQGKRGWNQTIEVVRMLPDGDWQTSVPAEAYPIVEVLGGVEIRDTGDGRVMLRIPGVKHRHYDSIAAARAAAPLY